MGCNPEDNKDLLDLLPIIEEPDLENKLLQFEWDEAEGKCINGLGEIGYNTEYVDGMNCVDFRSVDLSSIGELSGKDLKGSNFSGLRLSQVNFETSDLSGSVFDHCVFDNVEFPANSWEDASFQSSMFLTGNLENAALFDYLKTKFSTYIAGQVSLPEGEVPPVNQGDEFRDSELIDDLIADGTISVTEAIRMHRSAIQAIREDIREQKNQKLPGLEQITLIRESISELRLEMDEVKAQIQEEKNQMLPLQNEKRGIKDSIAAIKNDIRSLREDIALWKIEKSSTSDPSEELVLENKILLAQAEILELRSEIDGHKIAIKNLNDELSVFKSAIRTLKEVNKSKLDIIRGKRLEIAEIKSTFSVPNENIANYRQEILEHKLLIIDLKQSLLP